MNVWQQIGWALAVPGFAVVAGVAVFYGKGAAGYHWGGWRLPIALGSAAVGFTGVVAVLALVWSDGPDPDRGWIATPSTSAALGVAMLVIAVLAARFGRAYGDWAEARATVRAVQRTRRLPAAFSRVAGPLALAASGVVMIGTAIVR